MTDDRTPGTPPTEDVPEMRPEPFPAPEKTASAPRRRETANLVTRSIWDGIVEIFGYVLARVLGLAALGGVTVVALAIGFDVSLKVALGLAALAVIGFAVLFVFAWSDM